MVAVLSRGMVRVAGMSGQTASSGIESIVSRPVCRLHSDITVSLVASDKDDATRVSRLLRLSGLDTERLLFHDSMCGPIDAAFATVVCHRGADDKSLAATMQGLKRTRVIVLSDVSCESAVVKLLENGARHVFNVHESDTLLQVRLEAALREHRRASQQSFSIGDIQFDVPKRQVIRSGNRVRLSPKEYEFARYLFTKAGTVVSNSELMVAVWSLPTFMDTRRIDTAACRVRKKLSLIPSHGWELKKIRCVGYRLNAFQ